MNAWAYAAGVRLDFIRHHHVRPHSSLREAVPADRRRTRSGEGCRDAHAASTEPAALDPARAAAVCMDVDAPPNERLCREPNRNPIGQWRIGRASDYAFLAEVFVHAGAHLVVPDFVSVLDTGGDLTPLVEQVRRAVAWVHSNASRFGGDRSRIYVSGHSSGAHLAGVLATTDWPRLQLPADIIKGVVSCSGLYDLRPVRLSARREFLAITDDIEQAFSPQRQSLSPSSLLSLPFPVARLRCDSAGRREVGAAGEWRRLQPLRDLRNARQPLRHRRTRRARTTTLLDYMSHRDGGGSRRFRPALACARSGLRRR